MTGPEHYREAERLLGIATKNSDNMIALLNKGTRASAPSIETAQSAIASVTALAQVHATLAAVARQEVFS